MRHSFRVSAVIILVLNVSVFAQSPYAVRDYKANGSGAGNASTMSAAAAGSATALTSEPNREAPKDSSILPALGSASDSSSPSSCLFGDHSNCPKCPHIWVRGEYLLWWLSAPK